MGHFLNPYWESNNKRRSHLAGNHFYSKKSSYILKIITIYGSICKNKWKMCICLQIFWSRLWIAPFSFHYSWHLVIPLRGFTSVLGRREREGSFWGGTRSTTTESTPWSTVLLPTLKLTDAPHVSGNQFYP